LLYPTKISSISSTHSKRKNNKKAFEQKKEVTTLSSLQSLYDLNVFMMGRNWQGDLKKKLNDADITEDKLIGDLRRKAQEFITKNEIKEADQLTDRHINAIIRSVLVETPIKIGTQTSAHSYLQEIIKGGSFRYYVDNNRKQVAETSVENSFKRAGTNRAAFVGFVANQIKTLSPKEQKRLIDDDNALLEFILDRSKEQNLLNFGKSKASSLLSEVKVAVTSG